MTQAKPLCGFLNVLKPPGMSSAQVVGCVRRLLGGVKAGHAGTLDPMATGVLPLLFGRATRALDLLPVHDKRYTASLRFGAVSDTLDIWGKVTETGALPPSPEKIEAALSAFRGKIQQVPPMMSALKRDGIRLYDLARQGIEVERQARPVTIYSLDVLSYRQDSGELTLDCSCSRGTYIRTLCDDLGRMLGCGAVMTSLRRTQAAGISLEQCVTLDEAKRLAESSTIAGRMTPVEHAFGVYPPLTVTAAQAVRFSNGGALALDRLRGPVAGICRVYGPDGFLGLGKPADDELKVWKLF